MLGTRSIQPKLTAKERNRKGKWQQKMDRKPLKVEGRVLLWASGPQHDSVSNGLMCLSPCFPGVTLVERQRVKTVTVTEEGGCLQGPNSP